MRVLSLAVSGVRSMWPSSRKARTATAVTLTVAAVVTLTAYDQNCCGLLLSILEHTLNALLTLLAVVIQWSKSDGSLKQISDANMVYVGSATIVSFASFGSVLTIRVYMNPASFKTQARGLILVLGSVIMTISIHTIIMIGACCMGVPKAALGLGLFVASVFLMLVVFGYAMMVDAQSKERKRRTFWKDLNTSSSGRATGS